MKKYSFFLPTRKGSERVANKNTRTFAGLKGGILKIKLQQLMQIERVQSIVISTNDPDTIDIARSFNSSRIKIIERPEHLSTTYLPSLMQNIFFGYTQLLHLLMRMCSMKPWTVMRRKFLMTMNMIAY